MKKLIWLFLSFLVLGVSFHACSDSKTYAEQLKDERNAINDFIKKNNIKVISLEEFEKDTITNVDENEYVLFPSVGVYMQIIDRGTGDTLKNRDEVLVRFLEYDIMADDTTIASNYNVDGRVDAFYYTHPDNSYNEFGSGQFIFRDGYPESILIRWYSQYINIDQLVSVPMGWLVPLRYIKNDAHVKIIVPSKQGHPYAMKEVYPYFYDMRRIRIR